MVGGTLTIGTEKEGGLKLQISLPLQQTIQGEA